MKRIVVAILVSALTAMALPALAADPLEAGQATGTGQSDAAAEASSRKGYDSWKAHSDMGAAAPSSRAPAGVTHEYHRATAACADDGRDADCNGSAELDGAPKTPHGSDPGSTR